jgi:hypothetical protein
MTTETAHASIATSEEMNMRRLAKISRSLMLSALATGVILAGAPCDAQDVDPPTPPKVGEARGSIFAPSAWMALNTPVQKRVDLKVYGFYIGELGVPVAQVDLPIRTTKFLTITPSYMYYSVPASGLNKLTPEPGHFPDSYRYDESQFRIDGTFAFPIHKLEMSVRTMYVRRFRPTPLNDIDRYRGRVGIAYPLAVHGRIVKPFASYETFYEPHNGGWNRQRTWVGVTLPVNPRFAVQPSYLWERSDGSRDIHYLLLGLIVNTRKGH